MADALLLNADALAAAAAKAKAVAIAAAAATAWFTSPIYKVVQLLGNITAKIEAQGNEQLSAYDKYSCWVKDKLANKTADINAAKKLIGDLTDDIRKLKGATAARGADIAQRKKDIAETQELIKSSTAERKKEKSDYVDKKADLDASNYALETSIETLKKGSGTSFLQVATGSNLQVREAELMGVASDLNSFVQSSQGQAKLSDEQLETVKQFVQNPRSVSSLTQVDTENGYASSSINVILGIVKAMRDSVQADLASAKSADEASETSFQTILASKKQGLGVLTNELTTQSADQATDTQTLATSEKTADTTKAQLEADEEFFADTKKAAIAKAQEWNKVSRLRSEEMLGLQKAMTTLSAAKNTFGEASLSKKSVASLEFLQVQSRREMSLMEELTSSDKAIPKKQAQEVISKIDNMRAVLTKEEQDDIDNRDDCEAKIQANTNKLADIAFATTKANQALQATVLKIKTLRDNLGAIMRKIAGTRKDMNALTDQRESENLAFRRALEADKQSAKVIGTALAVLTKFYKSQGQDVEKKEELDKMAMHEDVGLLQDYTDADGPPKADLGGDHSSQTTGVVAILSMMKEDFEKEMKEGSDDEAEALSDYEAGMAALQKTLDAEIDAKGSFEKDLAAAAKTKVKNDNAVTEAANDLDAATAVKTVLDKDCAWIRDQTFEKRRTQRKSEMDSIASAKDFLGDIMSGKPVLFFQAP